MNVRYNSDNFHGTMCGKKINCHGGCYIHISMFLLGVYEEVL